MQVSRVLSEAYGLGQVESCAVVSGGMLNDNYQLSTDKGRFLVKRYRARSFVARRHERSLLGSLIAKGVPAVCPLEPRRPARLSTYASSRFAVYPWVEGSHLAGSQMSASTTRDVGALMARAQAALHQSLGPVQQRFFWPVSDPMQTVQRIADLQRVIRARPVQGDLERWSLEALDDRRDELHRRSHERPANSGILTSAWIHGDFNPLNILFARAAPIALLDWERVSVQPQVLELIRTGVLWFSNADDGRIDLDRIRDLAEGYFRVVSLPPHELIDVLERFWWDKLNDSWLFRRRYLEHREENAELLVAHVRWVRWLSSNRAAMGSALLEGRARAVGTG